MQSPKKLIADCAQGIKKKINETLHSKLFWAGMALAALRFGAEFGLTQLRNIRREWSRPFINQVEADLSKINTGSLYTIETIDDRLKIIDSAAVRPPGQIDLVEASLHSKEETDKIPLGSTHEYKVREINPVTKKVLNERAFSLTRSASPEAPATQAKAQTHR